MKGWTARLLVLAVLAFAFFVTWRCPLAAVAHVPCPGCGLTRAARLVAHGDFAAATAMHPLVWLVAPLVLGFAAIEVMGYAKTRRWGASKRVPHGTALLVVTALLLFAVWIARFFGAFGGPVPV